VLALHDEHLNMLRSLEQKTYRGVEIQSGRVAEMIKMI
jgi:hypothetical protein